jgi:hypothetical protein
MIMKATLKTLKKYWEAYKGVVKRRIKRSKSINLWKRVLKIASVSL